MAVRDPYLRPMLEAGSARVFNCCDRFRKLRQEGANNPHFFRHAPFHELVVIKEANFDPRVAKLGRSLVTKLYFPYNARDIYEGGRSVLLHEPRLLAVLNERVGLQGPNLSSEDVHNDLKMLRIMDAIPSLDLFLMRDALELEGFVPNPLYLDVSDAERAAIYDYIRLKFEPLVRAALGESAFEAGKVAYLVDKIWEAKDRDALGPLIEACRFPRDDALAIFAAWKGINFYTLAFERSKPRIDALQRWLQDVSVPRFGSIAADMDQIAYLKTSSLARLRSHTAVVEELVQEYEQTYARFLASREATVAFIDFLRRSRDVYWRIGEAMSALDHAVHCWEIGSAKFFERRLPAERLAHLLDCLVRVLVEGPRTGRAAAANFA